MSKQVKKEKNEFSLGKNILFVILILLLSAAIGMMIGYSLLGNGHNPIEVFRPSLWKEVFRLIF